MTTLKLANTSVPVLLEGDEVHAALQTLQTARMTHLPVVADEKYLGLLGEEDLIFQQNKSNLVGELREDFLPAQIGETKHFLHAVPLMQLYNTNVLPVLGEQMEYLGAIRQADLLHAVGNLCGANEFGALVVLEIAPSRLSVAEMNSIVESDGATILHLNISPVIATQTLRITLQINKQEVSTIVASFERYEYSILYYSGEEYFENQLNSNYQNLMNYLQI